MAASREWGDLQNQLHANGGENTRRSSKFREASRERCEEEAFEVDLTSEAKEERGLWMEHTLIGRVVGPRMTRATIREWISKHWGLRLIVKFIPRSFFIVVFDDGRERNKYLCKNNWFIEEHPLYLQPWFPNFNLVLLAIYDRPMWIRMYNLPMEYWGENCLEKIGRSLGILLEIDEELIEKDSYVYARLKIAAVKEIPSQISLVSSVGVWLQQVEIEKEIIPCSRCNSKMHLEGECRMYVRKANRNYLPKQTNKHRWVEKIVKLPLTISGNSHKDPEMVEKVAPIEKEASKMYLMENVGYPISDIENHNPVIKEDNQLPLTSNSKYEEDQNPKEEDIEDGLENLDPRCISQSANILSGREKGRRGRRSHKQVREEREFEKGIVSVIDFMKKSKGEDLSLGDR
ncbi:hypothetical protein SUGI_0392080 [Cryptomeria japonica]|nr:hypothetical protein SUGI_0392080 [Cryptomeria japonica]